MPTGMARNFIIPALPQFLAQHPHLELELSTTDRYVDLIREGFDCVLRAGTLSDSSLIAKPIGEMRIVNCASPDYLQRYGTPRTLDDLVQHRLIHFVQTLGSRPDAFEYHDGAVSHRVPMQNSLTVNSAVAYDAACLAGLGLIQVPLMGVRRLLESGALIEVLKDFQAAPMPVSLVYANRRNLPRRVREFMEWAPHLD